MSPASSILFEGHAIVTADGMIADAAGSMPPALRSEADWEGFQAALDRSALVVLGRRGHERHPNPGRRRLVLTTSVARLAPAPGDSGTMFWNPAGAAIDDVLRDLQIERGTIAITGGTGTFGHFLQYYDSFVLSEVHRLVLPSGTPCFSDGHPRLVLAAGGLQPGPLEPLDPAAGVTLTRWCRT